MGQVICSQTRCVKKATCQAVEGLPYRVIWWQGWVSTLERPTRKQQQNSWHQNIVSGTIAECGAHNISGTSISGGAVSGNDTIKVKLSCEAYTEAALSGDQLYITRWSYLNITVVFTHRLIDLLLLHVLCCVCSVLLSVLDCHKAPSDHWQCTLKLPFVQVIPTEWQCRSYQLNAPLWASTLNGLRPRGVVPMQESPQRKHRRDDKQEEINPFC